MKVYRSLAAFDPGRRRTAVAIGNFDGLHPGHQRLLQTMCWIAQKERLRPVVLTFDPHPERAFGRSRTLMIETLEQRLARLKAAGIESVIVTAFDRRMAGLSPREFIRNVLGNRLKAAVVVVGRDFRFGRNRAGDIRALRREGRPLGIRTVSVRPVRKRGRVASSSIIRGLLGRGRVEEAREVLGRPYAVRGRVVHGRAVGRRIGFPTANLASPNEILPLGVFITLVRVGQALHPAVTNIGFRPTFGRGGISLESILLDTSRNLYGRNLEVLFLKKLRPERRFRNRQALARRISLDVQTAQAYFRKHRPRRSSL